MTLFEATNGSPSPAQARPAARAGRRRDAGAPVAQDGETGPDEGPAPDPAAVRAGLAERADHGRPAERALPGGAYLLWGKRAASLVLLLIVLGPALLLALPIALVNLVLFRDPRRILFSQPRIGLRGRVFRIWKFRTMREPERGLERGAAGQRHFHSWSDGHDGLRVTRFGRLLRNTHLDELPQLINVLLGEMDFVGPRPEMVEVHAWACARIPGFAQRTAVRPGITGLAQVTQGYAGRDERAYRAKLAADLRYVRGLSFPGDLRLILLTLVWMLEGRGWLPMTELARLARLAEEDAEATGPTPAGATMVPCPRPASSTTRAPSTTTRGPRIPSAHAD